MQEAVDTYRRAGVGPGASPRRRCSAGSWEPGLLPWPRGRALSSYVPDIAALRASPVRVVAGVGASSVGQLAHRCGVALAERLGSDPVSFPGDHSGFMSLPEAFAQALGTVLRG
jgi:hypothetical protein